MIAIHLADDPDHPIDLTRWQLVNCYMGRVPLINSGGESKGEGDLGQAVRTAVINKRAGGTGLMSSWGHRRVGPDGRLGLQLGR